MKDMEVCSKNNSNDNNHGKSLCFGKYIQNVGQEKQIHTSPRRRFPPIKPPRIDATNVYQI